MALLLCIVCLKSTKASKQCTNTLLACFDRPGLSIPILYIRSWIRIRGAGPLLQNKWWQGLLAEIEQIKHAICILIESSQ